MKQFNLTIFLIIGIFFCASAQSVGIGISDPDSSAALHIQSSDQGIMIPSLSSTNRNNISNPLKGLLVFDSTANAFYYYNGAKWNELPNQTLWGGESEIYNLEYEYQDFIFGSDQISYSTDSDKWKRFLFYKLQGAFRAGITTDNSWDYDSLGYASAAFGYNTTAEGAYTFSSGRGNVSRGSYSSSLGYLNKALGGYSLAVGHSNISSGWYSTSLGFDNETSGQYSFAAGSGNTSSGVVSTSLGADNTSSGGGSFTSGELNIASGLYSNAIGFENKAKTNFSSAIGQGTVSNSFGEFSIGLYNNSDSAVNKTAWNGNDILLGVGNGINNSTRSNALTIYKDGRLNINDAFTFPNSDGSSNQILQTDGSGNLSWVNEPSTGAFVNVSGLVQNSGNNASDDLIFGSDQLPQPLLSLYSDTMMLFNKGKAAFRVGGFSNSRNWTEDSLGSYSFAAGRNAKATGQYSVAFGTGSVARGTNSICFGDGIAEGTNSLSIGVATEARGLYAIAIGDDCDALKNNSIAIGKDAKCNEINSISIGTDNSSIGRNSLTLGTGLNAPSYGEVVLGTYNTSYTATSTTGHAMADRLFTIGNGTVIDSSDALVVKKDGKISVNHSDPKTTLDVDGGLTLRKDATINLTMDNQNVAVGDRSLIWFASNNTTASNRTVVLGDGEEIGQMLIVINKSASSARRLQVLDNDNTKLSASSHDMDLTDVLTLIWDGSDWLEISFADNQ